jgi:hypothetical protein
VVNRPPVKVGVLVLVAFALTLAFAGTAFAHNQESSTVSCDSVSGSFTQFAASDHPIVWHVSVDGGAFQAVATTESPAGFVGSGTASAGIATLTKAIGPSGGNVSYYAAWPGGQTGTTTAHLSTCDTPPTTPPTTPPPTSPPPTSPHAPPPIAVVVHPAPVAFAPPIATVAVPVVATPATAG